MATGVHDLSFESLPAVSRAILDESPGRAATMAWIAVPIIVVLIAVALLTDWALRNQRRTEVAQSLISAVEGGVVALSGDLRQMRRDLEFVLQSPGVYAESDARMEAETLELLTALSRSPQYQQVRWIDATGMERIRFNRSGETVSRVAPEQLQDKSDRPYVRTVLSMPRGTIWLSPIELNMEHGAIETPWRPVLRAAVPLFAQDGSSRGLIVLNRDVGPLLQRFESLNRPDTEVQLMDQDGYWLYSADPTLQWGRDLSHPEATLARRAPDIWDHYQSVAGRWRLDRDGSWAMVSVDDQGRVRSGAPSDPATSHYWWVAAHYPEAKLRQLLLPIDATITCVLVIAIVLTLMFSHRHAAASMARDRALADLSTAALALERSRDAQTALLRREREMKGQLVRAAKLSSLGLMVAGVAHELNTPLGSASLLHATLLEELERLRRSVDTGVRRAELERYIADCERQLGLLGDALGTSSSRLRMFRQLAVDRSGLEHRSYTIDGVLSALRQTLKLRDARNAERLKVVMPPRSVPMLYGYPGPLGQVLENLVLNALDHAYPPGVDGDVRVVVNAPVDGDLELSVEDDGVGIPAENLETIFEPFFTTRRGQGGTGLGLHLCAQLVHEVLGGRIDVDSGPGRGARFVVRVPRGVPRAAKTPTATPAGASVSSRA